MPWRYRADVELRQAQAFVAVADHGGFAAAAAELETVQPAVTRLIALERANDVVLFERTPRRVTITAAGERLLAAARALVVADVRLEAELVEVRGGRAGLLRIGTTVSMTSQATALAAAFAAEHPAVPQACEAWRIPRLGRVVSRGRAIAFLAGDLRSANGDVVATATASAIIRGEPK